MMTDAAPSPLAASAGDVMPARGAGRLWRHVSATLADAIATGCRQPGSRLPTETELAEQFGVNRHTVRRAVEELARAGLVRVEQGRGSFVADRVMDYGVMPRTRFSEWIRDQNMCPTARVLDIAEIAATGPVAEGLGLTAGAPVIRLERLGLADGRPVSLVSHHFPAALGDGLAAALRSAPTVTEALRRIGITDYRRQITRVGARMPHSRERALLGVGRGRPVLVTESVDVAPDGRAVEFGVARYPTPLVQIVFRP